MEVWAGDGLGVLEGVDFFFAMDLEMRAFLGVVIFEGVKVSDFTIEAGAIECCLTVGEDCAEEEEPIFNVVGSHFALKISFNFSNFSNFSKLRSYFKRWFLICSA